MGSHPVATRLRSGRASRLWRRAVIVVLAGGGLSLSWSSERHSVERANRVHREGRIAQAAELYGIRADRGDLAPDLQYNLGTALIGLGSPSGEAGLTQGMSSPSEEVQARARYNYGLSRLTRALEAGESDSTRVHAQASVEANRSALRLRPDDTNTKWNLAMGLRLLDSIDAAERRSGREMADGDLDADVVTRSQNVPDPAEDEFAEEPPQEGEDETLVEMGEESPLSREEAEQILGLSHLDATQILTKLLALESRSRFGRRRGRGARRW